MAAIAQSPSAAPLLVLRPLNTNVSFRDQAYIALRQAIMDADIYAHAEEIRLDERQLSQQLGVSRTPIREAMSLLEQEGFLRTVPRRGVFIVRKTIENLFIHVRAIRRMTISQSDRAARSIRDHMRIIEALERRDTELAERLVREHSLDLAAHVEKHCDFLD